VTRHRPAPFAAALLALLSACAGPTSGSTAAATGQEETALRKAAAVVGCPSGMGAALPALTLPCLAGGKDVQLASSHPARPTLVNVWATWCGPCVREVPELVDLARDGAGKVDVLGVLTEDDAGNGLEFARQFGMHYPSVIDRDGKVMRAFSPGPPVTLFLDPTGKITYVQRGEVKSSAALRALVREHLGVALPTTPGAGAPPR
jgi:cytochrome c biogenesis protein CcmG, thiol:disulfide interchange protein DsbE